MDGNVRVGVAGLVHDHVWGILAGFAADERATLVAAAEEAPDLCSRIAEELGVTRHYGTVEAMLAEEAVDCVLCCTENSRHADVVEACAASGVHVMCEKPMAATLEQADRMVHAAQTAGVTLMINYPTTWSAATQTAVRMAQEGAVGSVYQVRYRAAHHGPREIGCSEHFWSWLYDRQRNGAGALMDYCCYGAAISRWVMGRKANSVVASMGRLVKDDIPVEDNAVMLMEFGDAICIAEASWTQKGALPNAGPYIAGSEGTLCVVGGRLFIADLSTPEGRPIECEPLRHGLRNPAEHFLSVVLGEEPAVFAPVSASVCRDAQAALEAGLTAAETGSRTEVR